MCKSTACLHQKCRTGEEPRPPGSRAQHSAAVCVRAYLVTCLGSSILIEWLRGTEEVFGIYQVLKKRLSRLSFSAPECRCISQCASFETWCGWVGSTDFGFRQAWFEFLAPLTKPVTLGSLQKPVYFICEIKSVISEMPLVEDWGKD